VPALTLGMGSNVTPFSYNAQAVDVQQLQMTLRDITTADGMPRTEILVRTGLQRSVRRNFTAARWITGVGTGLGGLVGTAVGLVVFGGVWTALIALPIVATAGVAGAGSAMGYRAIYRHYLAKFTENVKQMLDGCAMHARTGGSFAPPRIEKGARLLPDAPSFDID
jgi:hypothetical protein